MHSHARSPWGPPSACRLTLYGVEKASSTVGPFLVSRPPSCKSVCHAASGYTRFLPIPRQAAQASRRGTRQTQLPPGSFSARHPPSQHSSGTAVCAEKRTHLPLEDSRPKVQRREHLAQTVGEATGGQPPGLEPV